MVAALSVASARQLDNLGWESRWDVTDVTNEVHFRKSLQELNELIMHRAMSTVSGDPGHRRWEALNVCKNSH